MNNIVWHKPNATPNALHTAFTHAHETLIWASKSRHSRHTFNYDLINSPSPNAQVTSVWRIPTVPKHEKPLRLLRWALLSSTREGELIFDPFCGSGTTAVAAKELNRAFVGPSWRRSSPSSPPRSRYPKGQPLREISERFWSDA